MKGKAWLGAMRLRTLPLAVGGIILGSFLPETKAFFSWGVFILAIITAGALQILSNLANDYGDFVKGTDNENRVGPKRALQSGVIKESEMSRALYVCGAICLASGLSLVFLAFGAEQLLPAIGMIALGLFAIWAAIRYTIGKRPYGYTGLGDVFVAFFFGIVSVWGVSFLYSHTWDIVLVLPALGYGFLAVGVLNINNMRDIENDRMSNKLTLVVKMGAQNARFYHAMLIAVSFCCFWLYLVFMDLPVISETPHKLRYLCLLAGLPVLVNTVRVLRHKANPAEYNVHLKGLSLASLLFVVLFVALLPFFVG